MVYLEAKLTYSQMLNNRERAKTQGGFEAAKSKAIAGMQVFKSLCEVLTKLSSDKSISFTDMRAELAKLKQS